MQPTKRGTRTHKNMRRTKLIKRKHIFGDSLLVFTEWQDSGGNKTLIATYGGWLGKYEFPK